MFGETPRVPDEECALPYTRDAPRSRYNTRTFFLSSTSSLFYFHDHAKNSAITVQLKLELTSRKFPLLLPSDKAFLPQLSTSRFLNGKRGFIEVYYRGFPLFLSFKFDLQSFKKFLNYFRPFLHYSAGNLYVGQKVTR